MEGFFSKRECELEPAKALLNEVVIFIGHRGKRGPCGVGISDGG